jgi:aryl-alcohol dehydrogenase-like predicted oxidoreductase
MEAHRAAAQFGLIGPSVEQPQYNLLERNKMEYEFLDIFRTVGMGTTIWSPLASGLLTGKYNNGIPEGSRFALEGFGWLKDQWMLEDKLAKVRKLGDVANELGTSLATLSIAWCVSNPNVTTAILGATKKEQLVENLKASEILPKLKEEVLKRIDEIMQTKPELAEY